MSTISPLRDATDHRDTVTTRLTTSWAGVVAFMTVVSEGSFSGAAHRLGVGRSAVSRSVQKLEAQLDTRLLSRTTRCTTITREGEQFYENCRHGVEKLLHALEEMRDLRDGPPQGELKISAPFGFGRKVVAPLLAQFRALHPSLALELVLEDRVSDLAAERIDVAFRDGRLEDSQVIAKQLIPMRMLVCASNDYARLHGLPTSVEDLALHACINQRLPNGRLQTWDFKVDGIARSVTPASAIVVNDPSLAMQAVLEGQGLAQLAAYQVCDALRAGLAVTCLNALGPDDRGHYLCYLTRQQLPKRIRVFIDFMTTGIRALDLDCSFLLGSRHPAPPVPGADKRQGVAA